MSKRVLIVATSHSQFEGNPPHPTGVWLSEFAEPYVELKKAGFDIVVASPLGGALPIDPNSKPTAEQETAWSEAIEATKQTLLLENVTSNSFDGIFVPGGHGAMFDLPENPNLAVLLRNFFEEGKLIAAVCHGPAALVGAKRSNGEPLVKGVALTSFTYTEEVEAKLDQKVPFILEHRLRELGANFIGRENFADHIERDAQFLTGQNPKSGVSLAKSMVAALTKSFQPFLNVVGSLNIPGETFAEFPVNTFIENIVVSPSGAIYVTSYEEGAVYRVESGSRQLVANVEKAAGLALDSNNNLLVGSSYGSKTPGIFRVVDGVAEILIPMPDAAFLNGLHHLEGSRYLAADSFRGLIWEFDIDTKSYRIWIENIALATNVDLFHPMPQYFPGVNGIKRFKNYVYASSTQQQKLARIALNADGTAGALEVWMTNINLDDFAFDNQGNLYGTTHIFNSLVRIDPERRITILAGADAGLVGTTAVAFGRTETDKLSVYVTTNGGMSKPLNGVVQPGRVVKLNVGAAGEF